MAFTPKRLGIAILVVSSLLVIYETWRVLEVRNRTPALLVRVSDRADPQLANLNRTFIDILIAVEDPTFWSNDGLDFTTPGQGLTTLTQALAKQLYFDRFTPGFQKLELLLLAKYALTPSATKQEILTAFLTLAYLGQDEFGPVIGFPQAARRWHGKNLAELDDSEFISLVAMLPMPNSLDPINHAQENKIRSLRIQRLISGSCEPSGLTDVMLDGCQAP
ncbi:MAG: transglycosylase domain-containing protein [Rhodospirillaceae bacterium]